VVKSLLFGSLALVAVCLAGCSDQSNVQEPAVPELPGMLGRLQGEWVPLGTNGCTSNCLVSIDGRSVRVRYQEAPGTTSVRESALIDRIDEQRRLLVINGETGAWKYKYGTEGGAEHLELEFFSSDLDGNWRWMSLVRGEP
jgi:hypothetical protein